MEPIRILSTKKLVPSVIKDAYTKGIEIIEKEFISIHHITTEQKKKEVDKWLEADNNYLAFTSSSSVIALSKLLGTKVSFPETGWTIFGLSGKTFQELKKMFPDDVIVRAESAKELAEQILIYKPKDIVFFCGDRRRDELPDILTQQHIVVHEVILYETHEEPIAVSDHFSAVLFFSPTGVNSFFAANEPAPSTVCFAIGTTTGDHIASMSTNEIIVAEKPTQESVLDAVKKYFTKQL